VEGDWENDGNKRCKMWMKLDSRHCR